MSGGEAPLPHIRSMEPSSGPAGEAYPIRVTVTGGPFSPTGNRVRFGAVVVGEVPSPDGRTLTFQVPKSRPSTGEAPPMVLPPGRYEVSVEVDGARSPPATFVLTRGGP
ncbi:MAG: IPT/TIG domain-containing protein [Gemmatimonadota bacterium]|jgi:hypothetical protein